MPETPKANQTDPDQQIHNHLERIIRVFYHAINKRNFSPSSDPWQSNFSPNFADDCSGIPHDARLYIAKQYPGDIRDLDIDLYSSKLATNLQAFLHVEALLAVACPEYRYDVGEEMQVSVIRKARYASVIAPVHMLGLPPGTVRPSVTLFEFEKNVDENWLCNEEQEFAGHASGL